MDRKSNFTRFLFFLIALAILLFPIFSTFCLAKTVTLGWDANPEPDLDGYVIYRNVGSPGPPYKFSSTLPEDDLSNPLNPVVTLTGLKENTEYFIALTAYDTEGNESYFSDEVCVQVIDSVIEDCTLRLNTNSISSKSGGSGGSVGCFIDSSAGDLNNAALFGVIFAFGLVLMVVFRVFALLFRSQLNSLR